MAQQEVESSLVEIARSAAVLFHEGRMPISVSVWYSNGSAWQPSLGSDSLGQIEWEPVLAQILRSALERRDRSHLWPVCVTVWFSDHTCVQYGLSAGEPPGMESADDLSGCKQDITRVLHEKQSRLTTSKILQELRAHDLYWGESTVKRSLADMVREGELTNRSGVRPRGYGLPSWD